MHRKHRLRPTRKKRRKPRRKNQQARQRKPERSAWRQVGQRPRVRLPRRPSSVPKGKYLNFRSRCFNPLLLLRGRGLRGFLPLRILGMVALEAMACGTPVIASRVGGLTTAVKDGKTGYLVPDGNHYALAQCIITLLEDGEQRKGMGQEGRKAAQAYAWPIIADQIIALYNALGPEAVAGSLPAFKKQPTCVEQREATRPLQFLPRKTIRPQMPVKPSPPAARPLLKQKPVAASSAPISPRGR